MLCGDQVAADIRQTPSFRPVLHTSIGTPTSTSDANDAGGVDEEEVGQEQATTSQAKAMTRLTPPSTSTELTRPTTAPQPAATVKATARAMSCSRRRTSHRRWRWHWQRNLYEQMQVVTQSSWFSVALTLVLSIGYVHAVAECMSNNKLKCFSCNSHVDEYCADPFNWTTLPPRKLCEGCCVKLVQGIGTPDKKIRRGCTEELEMNMFMVDHVCLSEGGGKGKMCFCEENECNGTATSGQSMTILVASVFASLAILAHGRGRGRGHAGLEH